MRCTFHLCSQVLSYPAKNMACTKAPVAVDPVLQVSRVLLRDEPLSTFQTSLLQSFRVFPPLSQCTFLWLSIPQPPKNGQNGPKSLNTHLLMTATATETGNKSMKKSSTRPMCWTRPWDDKGGVHKTTLPGFEFAALAEVLAHLLPSSVNVRVAAYFIIFGHPGHFQAAEFLLFPVFLSIFDRLYVLMNHCWTLLHAILCWCVLLGRQICELYNLLCRPPSLVPLAGDWLAVCVQSHFCAPTEGVAYSCELIQRASNGAERAATGHWPPSPRCLPSKIASSLFVSPATCVFHSHARKAAHGVMLSGVVVALNGKAVLQFGCGLSLVSRVSLSGIRIRHEGEEWSNSVNKRTAHSPFPPAVTLGTLAGLRQKPTLTPQKGSGNAAGPLPPPQRAGRKHDGSSGGCTAPGTRLSMGSGSPPFPMGARMGALRGRPQVFVSTAPPTARPIMGPVRVSSERTQCDQTGAKPLRNLL